MGVWGGGGVREIMIIFFVHSFHLLYFLKSYARHAHSINLKLDRGVFGT